WSCDLRCPPQRERDLGARRLPALLHECANHDDSAAGRGDVECPGYSFPPRQAQLPQLALEVLYVWLGQTLQPSRSNAFSKAQKPRLHVGRESGDFGGPGFM